MRKRDVIILMSINHITGRTVEGRKNAYCTVTDEEALLRNIPSVSKNNSGFARKNSELLEEVISKIANWKPDSGDNIFLIQSKFREDRNTLAFLVLKTFIGKGFKILLISNGENLEEPSNELLSGNGKVVMLIDASTGSDENGENSPQKLLNRIRMGAVSSEMKRVPVLALYEGADRLEEGSGSRPDDVTVEGSSNPGTRSAAFLLGYILISVPIFLGFISQAYPTIVEFLVDPSSHFTVHGTVNVGFVLTYSLFYVITIISLLGVAGAIITFFSRRHLSRRKYRIMSAGLVLLIIGMSITPFINVFFFQNLVNHGLFEIETLLTLSLSSVAYLLLTLWFVGKKLGVALVILIVARFAVTSIMNLLLQVPGRAIMPLNLRILTLFRVSGMVPRIILPIASGMMFATMVYIGVKSHIKPEILGSTQAM